LDVAPRTYTKTRDRDCLEPRLRSDSMSNYFSIPGGTSRIFLRTGYVVTIVTADPMAVEL